MIDNADGEPPHDVLEDLLGASGFFDDRAAEVLVFFRPWRILDAVRAVEKRVADGEPIHSFRAQVATYLSQNCNEDHLRMGEVRAEPERFQRLIVALTPESKKRRQRA